MLIEFIISALNLNKIIFVCSEVCKAESCFNDGLCTPVDDFNEGTGGRFLCLCSDGYSGARCEEG